MPIPFIVGGLIAAAAAASGIALYQFFKGDSAPTVSYKYCNSVASKEKIKTIKQNIFETIEYLIKNHASFKIGETANPEARAGNEDYASYKTMYLLCKSKNSSIIDELEAFFIDKYISNAKNQNQNRGSGGKMNINNPLFYLYIIVK